MATLWKIMLFNINMGSVPITWLKAANFFSEKYIGKPLFWINFAALLLVLFERVGKKFIVSLNWNINIAYEGKAFFKSNNRLNITLGIKRVTINYSEGQIRSWEIGSLTGLWILAKLQQQCLAHKRFSLNICWVMNSISL